MFISAPTLDDLLRRVLTKLLASTNYVTPTKGATTELTCVLLQITNPRARLSRTEAKGTLFSCLGECLWYLAGADDLKFIGYYLKNYKQFSDDGVTLHGAYGPRLFNMRRHDQVANVIALLKKKPASRQAVIQLFDAKDIAKKHKDVPCTCTLQFMIRGGRLLMFTNMRSNDAFIGLPHDIFAFTMMQEIVARALKLEPGTYSHAVGSLHLYKTNRDAARKYLKEGWQSTVVMRPMPKGEPWASIQKLLKAERAIRKGRSVSVGRLRLDRYWSDVVQLLQIYWHFKRGESDKIAQIKKKISVRVYDPYIDDKKQSAERTKSKAAA
ncbi:MAG: thymidylate synthase [Steroidobacteraceae bacterium]